MTVSNNSMIVSERFRGRVQGPVNKVCIFFFYPLKLKQNECKIYLIVYKGTKKLEKHCLNQGV